MWPSICETRCDHFSCVVVYACFLESVVQAEDVIVDVELVTGGWKECDGHNDRDMKEREYRA